MITFVIIFIVFCLFLEIKPIKRFLKGKDPNEKLIENIERQDKKEKHITRTGGLENDRLNERQ
jgi:hypothetical protein